MKVLSAPRYAVTKRLRLIDFLLDQFGYVNRAHLMEYYGISSVQASKDIKDYLALAPCNLAYDLVGKTYRKGEAFRRVYE